MALTTQINRAAGSTVPLRVQLKNNGLGIDLTGSTVLFRMMDTQYWMGSNYQPPQSGLYHDVSHMKVVDAVCTADADTSTYPIASGWIVWSPTAANVDTPGEWLVQWRVVYPDNTVELFPVDLEEEVTILHLGGSLFNLPTN